MSFFEESLSTAQRLPPVERLRLMRHLWESLSDESWPALSDEELIELRRHLSRRDISIAEAVPWPIVERLLADSMRSAHRKVYSAPRRFDLSTLFIVTVAFSLLFGGMRWLQFPAGVSLAVGGFIALVGFGQALLFGGRRPRTASLVIGALVCFLAMLGYWLAGGPRAYPTAYLLIVGGYTLVGGALLGYAAGAAVGGVFMLAELLRKARQRNPTNRDYETD